MSKPSRDPEHPFVSRGGLKLRCALDTFALDPTGLVCADLGSSTGGFTDCLLQAGAAHVYAVDTGYGIIAWKLRSDPRVTVLERANALHTDPPSQIAHGVDLVVLDLGWTRQPHAIPAALRWLGSGGRIITLIKPHYEQPQQTDARKGKLRVLTSEQAEGITNHIVQTQLPKLGVRVLGLVKSPILGGKSRRGAGRGNAEWLALLEAAHLPQYPQKDSQAGREPEPHP